jgi:hypothetical protein
MFFLQQHSICFSMPIWWLRLLFYVERPAYRMKNLSNCPGMVIFFKVADAALGTGWIAKRFLNNKNNYE